VLDSSDWPGAFCFTGGGGRVVKCYWDTDCSAFTPFEDKSDVLKDNCWEINSCLLRFQCKIRR